MNLPDYWGDASTVALPKFEKRLRNLRGVSVKFDNLVSNSVVNPDTPITVNSRGAGRKPVTIKNPYVGARTDLYELDNLLSGVSHLREGKTTHKGAVLNVSVLRKIVSDMEVITAPLIARKFDYSEKQARRYMQGAKIIFQEIHKYHTVYKDEFDDMPE